MGRRFGGRAKFQLLENFCGAKNSTRADMPRMHKELLNTHTTQFLSADTRLPFMLRIKVFLYSEGGRNCRTSVLQLVEFSS